MVINPKTTPSFREWKVDWSVYRFDIKNKCTPAFASYVATLFYSIAMDSTGVKATIFPCALDYTVARESCLRLHQLRVSQPKENVQSISSMMSLLYICVQNRPYRAGLQGYWFYFLVRVKPWRRFFHSRMYSSLKVCRMRIDELWLADTQLDCLQCGWYAYRYF